MEFKKVMEVGRTMKFSEQTVLLAKATGSCVYKTHDYNYAAFVKLITTKEFQECQHLLEFNIYDFCQSNSYIYYEFI